MPPSSAIRCLRVVIITPALYYGETRFESWLGYGLYREIQEERSICWEVTVSVTVRGVSTNMCLILNGYRDTAVFVQVILLCFVYNIQTSLYSQAQHTMFIIY